MTFSVPRDPKAETRTRRALGSVADILNGLLRNGDIILTPNGYEVRREQVLPPGGTFGDADAPGDEMQFPGPPGARGLTGPTGAPGVSFDEPVDGMDGPPGPPGLRGVQGASGNPGADGEPGEDGFQGVPGPTGATGAAGSNGTSGATGATGPAGPAIFGFEEPPEPEWGPPGTAGQAGAAGATGATGSAGATGPAMNINPIINGNFDIWQRATSFTSIADGKYFADRWKYKKVGAVVHDISRSVDTPTPTQSGVYSKYGAQLVVTTVDSAIAAGDYCHIKQHIEGYWYALFAQMQFTLSFWVKSKLTGTYCVFFQNKDTADRSFVSEYTINVADTWEYKTVTVTAPPSAGTWDYESGIGLTVGFSQSCGSTFQTTAGSWQTGNFFGTSNQVNNTATGGGNGYFFISQVMLVLGATGVPLLQRSYGPELALCQRYATYLPAQPIGVAVSTNSLYNQGAITWPVTMRSTPALGVLPAAAYTANAGNAGTVTLASPTVQGGGFSNSGAVWTVSALIGLTCILEAEL